MMTLRETEASRYTERDTPIFVGTLEDIRSILDSLDGARARVARTGPGRLTGSERPQVDLRVAQEGGGDRLPRPKQAASSDAGHGPC